MNKQQFDILFRRYIADELSDEERAAFFVLLGDASKQTLLHEAMEKWWDETERFQDMSIDVDGQRRIRQVMERIAVSRPRRIVTPWWQWVAAACIALIGFFLMLYLFPDGTEKQKLARYEVVAGHGQKKRVRMPDGSVIHLNGGSTLQYDDAFNKSARRVTLAGEAYFEVAANPEKPFVVQTDPLYVQVLGTAFNVRAIEKDTAIQVVVAEGSVQVGGSDDSHPDAIIHAVLSPNERLTYDKASKQTAVEHIQDVGSWTAWKENVLVFQNQSFVEVAASLERWYGVQITFRNDQLERCRFTGEFVNLPINNVLDLLQKSSSFTYKLDGQHVYIDGSGCN